MYIDMCIYIIYIFEYIYIIYKIKSGPSKICGRQPLKNLKGYGLLYMYIYIYIYMYIYIIYIYIIYVKYIETYI